MATSISEAPDAGAFDPTWRLPIAVQGNSSPFSTSALILQQGVNGPFLPLIGGTLAAPGNLTIDGWLNISGIAEPGGVGAQPSFQVGPFTDNSEIPGSFVSITRTTNYTGGTGHGDTVATIATRTIVNGAPNYFVWPINATLDLNTTGISTGQHQGIGSSIFRHSGATLGFVYGGQLVDLTGLPPLIGSQSIGFELDFSHNGPDSTNIYYNPSLGNRAMFNMFAGNYTPPVWTPNTAITAQGTGANVLSIITASPTAGFVYIAQTSGTTGGTQPTWPTPVGSIVYQWTTLTGYATGSALRPTNSAFTYFATTGGTSGATEPTWPTTPNSTVVDGSITWQLTMVVDGGVTWALGTTVASTTAKILGLAARSGSSVGASITLQGVHLDAGINMGAMTLDTATNPTAAAIRIPSNCPIDFSGAVSGLGHQNLHTLQWTNSLGFIYSVTGTPVFYIGDDGTFAFGGPPAVGAIANFGGTQTVGIDLATANVTDALRMASDQRISFVGTANRYLQYRGATNRLYYVVAGTDVFSIDTSGNVRAAGTITGSTTP